MVVYLLLNEIINLMIELLVLFAGLAGRGYNHAASGVSGGTRQWRVALVRTWGLP